MKTSHLLSLTLALVISGCPLWVSAQAAAPAAASAAASAPPLNKSTPRAQTVVEKRDAATMPGDLRPENAVVPQISVPLGRTPPAPMLSKAEAERQNKAAANGGIDDAVARCRAMTTAPERAECRRQQQRDQPAQPAQPSKR